MLFFNYPSGICFILLTDIIYLLFVIDLDDSEDTLGGGEVVYTIKNEDETVSLLKFLLNCCDDEVYSIFSYYV